MTASTTQQGTPSKVSSGLRAGWIMPPFFHELPLNSPDSETTAQRLHAIASTVLPESSKDDQYSFAYLLGTQLEPMAESGAIYAGLCFLEVSGQSTASTVLVSQVPHDQSDEEIIPSLVSTLQGRYSHDNVQVIELPCGFAVSRIGAAPFALENQITGDIQAVERNIIQAFTPMPDTDEMLVFELSVFTPEGWELHCEVFAEVLKTLEWATDQEIEEARQLAGNSAVLQQPVIAPADREALEGTLSAWAIATLPGKPFVLQEDLLSSTPCADCWGKGLRSACQYQQEWRGGDVSPEEALDVLSATKSHFHGLGWHVHQSTSGGLDAYGDKFAVTITFSPETGLRTQASTVCTRISNTAVADDFG